MMRPSDLAGKPPAANRQQNSEELFTTHLLSGQVDTDRANATADVQQDGVRIEAGQFGDGFVQDLGRF